MPSPIDCDNSVPSTQLIVSAVNVSKKIVMRRTLIIFLLWEIILCTLAKIGEKLQMNDTKWKLWLTFVKMMFYQKMTKIMSKNNFWERFSLFKWRLGHDSSFFGIARLRSSSRRINRVDYARLNEHGYQWRILSIIMFVYTYISIYMYIES